MPEPSRPEVIENPLLPPLSPSPPFLLRSHFGSSHFLFKRSRWFSRWRAFLVLTCPSVYNSVLLFPICSHGVCWRWVKRAFFSRSPATSSNFGSPDGSGPDLDGMPHHSHDAQFKEVRDMLLPLVQGFKDLDKHSRPFVRPWYCHLQNYWCRTDRQYTLCQNGFICRDGAKCQRPFTERLLQFPCEQFHAGVSTWFDKFLATADIPAANSPIEIHCKTGSRSARLVFETRAKVSRIRGTFQRWWYSVSLLWCANQNHKMIVKLENDLHHFGMFCLKK